MSGPTCTAGTRHAFRRLLVIVYAQGIHPSLAIVPPGLASASQQPELRQTIDILLAGDIPKLKDVEEYLIEKALRKAGNNQTLAAQMLGVSQSTLSRRMKPDAG